MKAIATINFKGGVGKTTITWLLAKLASEQKRVLVVDADAQMSLTTVLSVDEKSGTFVSQFGPWYENDHIAGKRTLLDALDAYDKYAKGNVQHFNFPVDKRLIYEVTPSLHFIPSTDDLYWMELGLFHPDNVKGFVNALLGRIGNTRPYDVVLFDCPPSFTLLSYSVLSNCSLILVPVNPDVFAARGVRIMVEGLKHRVQPWPEPAITVFMNKARGNYHGSVFSPFSDTYTVLAEVGAEVKKLNKTANVISLKTLIPDRRGISKVISFGGFPTAFRPEFRTQDIAPTG